MLIDIDLDELQFYLNPTMEKMEPLLKQIVEAYIEEYGEEYREKIEKNASKNTETMFIAYTRQMNYFIQDFLDEIIHSAYEGLATSFHISLNKYQLETNTFIEKVLKENNIYSTSNDKNLTIFRTKIKEHIEKIKEHLTDPEEVKYLEDILEYIDKTVTKFDKIMEVLKPSMDYIKESKQKQEMIKKEIQREFIQKHQFMLTDHEKKWIQRNPNCNIDALIQTSSNIQNYIGPSIGIPVTPGRLNFFAEEYDNDEIYQTFREMQLTKLGIDYKQENLDLSNGEACLQRIGYTYIGEDGLTYEGNKALQKTKEEIEMYNQKYQEATKKCDHLIPYEELVHQLEIILTKQFVRIKNPQHIYSAAKIMFPEIDDRSSEGAYHTLNITLTEENGNVITEYPNLIIEYHIQVLEIKNGKVKENMINIFSHEVGHAITAVDSKQISGIFIKEENRSLNELINEYMNGKVLEKLRKRGVLKDNDQIEHIQQSIHKDNRFLIEPFIEEYEDIFKKATMENDPSVIIKCMGEEAFQEYITLINDYYRYQKEWAIQNSQPEASRFISENEEYIAKVKQKINEILEQVKEKNVGHLNF